MFKFTNLLLLSAGILLAIGSTGAAAGANGSDKLSPGEHDAPVRDVQLHYTIAGTGPLVFVCSPGWGAGSLYLQRGLAPLEDQFTLLFIDTRGSGKSTRPADPKVMSSSDMADDIDVLRGYLGLYRINLIGHSDSGAIGLYYAERYPTRLGKLVVIDGVSYGDGTNDKEETDNEKQIRLRLADDPRYKTALQPFKPEPGDTGMMQYLQHTLALSFADPEKNIPLFAKSMEGMTPSSFAAKANMGANHLQRKDSTAHLGEIKAATLIIVGKQDWICPVLNAEHMHERIAGSQLVEIDGSGHFPWIEQPTLLFKSVAEFLAK
jgi:pimeloyl-ACP methyl ester carboxylesterase